MTGRKRAAPRKITASLLDNVALHYLERFAGSAADLRRVLMRRVARAAEHHASDPAEGTALVEALILRFQQSGLIDDRRYAEARAASLRRRGGSRRGISARLTQHGVERPLIAATLQALTEETGGSDLAAACAFIRRRRLGAYRTAAARPASLEKDMATLARAGFSFGVARKVLACPDIEALETLLAEDG